MSQILVKSACKAFLDEGSCACRFHREKPNSFDTWGQCIACGHARHRHCTRKQRDAEWKQLALANPWGGLTCMAIPPDADIGPCWCRCDQGMDVFGPSGDDCKACHHSRSAHWKAAEAQEYAKFKRSAQKGLDPTN